MLLVSHVWLVCRAWAGKHNKPKSGTESIHPWSLPHTGHLHSQWRGLYGRLSNYGHTSTLITNMTLIGKVRAWRLKAA